MIDLLVAGGGPVGLATALHARAAGLDVTVVEPRLAPVDKACGEGLMPGALAGLQALGVDPIGRPFLGIRYVGRGATAEARFAAGPGRGVRRTVLHAALSAAADDAGVVRVRGRVGQVTQRPGYVEARGQRARYLVAADGLHSPVRRALGLDAEVGGISPWFGPRFGLRRHFRVPAWTDLVEVHWAKAGEAYVTPVEDDLVGVAFLGGPGRSYDSVLRDFPVLHDRLRAAEPVTSVRGAGPLRQVATARTCGRVLLVGDAAGYVDALTGEGIATGLAGAEAAVAAVVRGRPEEYEQAWRQVTRRYRLLTNGLLAAVQRPPLRRGLVPAAHRLPGLFGMAVQSLAYNK